MRQALSAAQAAPRLSDGRGTRSRRSSRPRLPAGADVSNALQTLLARFEGLVHGIGRQRGLSEADIDEMVQDVRIRLWHALKNPERLQTANASYLYRTALSAAIDLIRRRRSDQEISLDHSVAAVGDPSRDLENDELGQEVFRAVECITPSRRPAVRMHLAGYHRNEIASLLDWSEGKTRNLLYRGLADLRAQLHAQGVSR